MGGLSENIVSCTSEVTTRNSHLPAICFSFATSIVSTGAFCPPKQAKSPIISEKINPDFSSVFNRPGFFFALMSLIDSMVGVAFYHELLVVWLCLRLWHTTIYLSMLTLLWVMVYNMFFPSISPCYRLNWNLKLNKCLNLKPKMRSCLLFNKKNEMNHFCSTLLYILYWSDKRFIIRHFWRMIMNGDFIFKDFLL